VRKRFDRTIGGEGKLIKREKADRERGISGFWGYDWNKVYIGYCDGASFGGVMMMGMMMGMTLSRSVDIHECATYAIGAVEVKTGAILHEQGIQYENKFYLSYCIRYSWRIAPVLTSTAPIAYVVHSWISMLKMLRWLPPRLPHELYDCCNGFTLILYTSLTHVLRVTEESIPLVEIRPLMYLKISS